MNNLRRVKKVSQKMEKNRRVKVKPVQQTVADKTVWALSKTVRRKTSAAIVRARGRQEAERDSVAK